MRVQALFQGDGDSAQEKLHKNPCFPGSCFLVWKQTISKINKKKRKRKTQTMSANDKC